MNFLRAYYTVFDLEKATIGFADSDYLRDGTFGIEIKEDKKVVDEDDGYITIKIKKSKAILIAIVSVAVVLLGLCTLMIIFCRKRNNEGE